MKFHTELAKDTILHKNVMPHLPKKIYQSQVAVSRVPTTVSQLDFQECKHEKLHLQLNDVMESLRYLSQFVHVNRIIFKAKFSTVIIS